MVKKKTSNHFKRGHIPWNKGKTGAYSLSKEHRENIGKGLLGRRVSKTTKRKIGKANRIALLGHRPSEESKKKMSEAKKREKHWNWQGGITNENKLERRRFYKYFRGKVLERDDYTCQACAKRGCFLHVDHIKSWRKYPSLRFKLGNCRTLCQECHYKFTFHRDLPQKATTWGQNLSYLLQGYENEPQRIS